jgi:glycosyltransferase involved in cell wall biosynthesis
VSASTITANFAFGRTVLLDLSGDDKAATSWARLTFPGVEVERVHKQDLKWASKNQALRSIKELRPSTFAVFTGDLQVQSSRAAIAIFGALAGAHTIVMGDRQGQTIVRGRLRILILDSLRLGLELAVGYGLLIPFAWSVTFVFQRLGPLLKASEQEARCPTASDKRLAGSDTVRSRSVIYLRAAPTASGPAASQAGGMATHVAGFTEGVLSLGHRLRFISSGDVNVTGGEARVQVVPPCGAFNATRTLFELCCSLCFAVKAFSIANNPDPDFHNFDFIYQRYNRFNCTGVLLSIATGKPLLLEINGSEIWIAKNWDPIGQIGLLALIEKINFQCADLIVVVSEADRRMLRSEGIEDAKIVLNPNGVDTNTFRPGCGGIEIRRKLGLDDKIVIGFLGTFGPWHGATVLAEAAVLLTGRPEYHFLFIGDGDQRPVAEAMLESGGASGNATFVGKVAHDQAPCYLDACDILVSPHVEMPDGREFFGSPTKLFEYLAMAKPVIGSRLGQIGSLITDGYNGLLIPPGDSRALTEAIDRLADGASLRSELGKHARETVAGNYTWRHNAARVFDAFEERIATASPPTS